MEVFGSVSRGDAHAGSDVDLLIEFRPDLHVGWDFFDLQQELENVLGCRVDLLTRRSVERDQNSIRRRAILESTQEIYAA